MLGRVDEASVRRAQDERNRELAARAAADAAEVADDLVEHRGHEAVELDLGDGLHSVDGEADRAAHDADLGERRVDDPFIPVLLPKTVRRSKHPAVASDVLAED